MSNLHSSANNNSQPQALFTFRDHCAAVKALAWCPWQSNVLATGGGTADGKIHIWSASSGHRTHSQDTKSQVSALLWSRSYREIISSHGYAQNQLTLWKYPELSKQGDLLGHSNRVLSMVQSPDEEMVASVGADETLRLWKCFPRDDRFRRENSGGLERNANSHMSLARYIR